MTRPMLRIEFHFDLICPWCLLGKHYLRLALAQLACERPGLQVEVTWRPTQLLPHVPPQGLPFLEFYRQRLGSERAVARRMAEVGQAAAQAGIALNLQGIGTLPSTTLALRLLRHVALHASPGQHEQLIDELLAAYFQRACDLGDSAVLQACARACGMPDVTNWLCEDVPDLGKPQTSPLTAVVPMLVFNGRQALLGLQDTPALLHSMRLALLEEGAAPRRDALSPQTVCAP